MSGIVGIFNLDRSPVDADVLSRMNQSIAYRGRDASEQWIDGPVGFGHQMLHTTPESLLEKQPLLDETKNFCLVLDGRIDNRDELKKHLAEAGFPLRLDTDAEIVLRCYQCWGEECARMLIGDFAFALWDKPNQQIFCARDALGIKSFHYYCDGRRFLFASEFHAFFVDATVPREPNEGMVAEYLTATLINTQETLYKGVFCLPAGQCLIVRPGGLQKRTYWDINPDKKIRHSSDDEYAEHFLAILKEAVRSRMRCLGTLGAELGGVDSSAVVGIAQSLYRDGTVAATGFETFSMSFPGTVNDEISYVKQLVDMWGFRSNITYPDQSYAPTYAEDTRRYLDFPLFPNDVVQFPHYQLAKKKGLRVLLTGMGGDDWFTGNNIQLADFLRQGNLLGLYRQYRAARPLYREANGTSESLSHYTLIKLMLWPFVPLSLRRLTRRVLGRGKPHAWINPDLVRRTDLMERVLVEMSMNSPFPTFAQQSLYINLKSGWRSLIFEKMNRTDSRFGVEKRHPLLDRRVVEFAFAIPGEQRWRQNQYKVVLRNAVKGLVPESIRQRRSKADFSGPIVDACLALGGPSLFDNLAIEDLGWIDIDKARAMYREMLDLYSKKDDRYMGYIWYVWMVFGLDLWYKSVFVNSGAYSQTQRPIPGISTPLSVPA